MGIDHLRATGMPDVSNPGGPDVAVPVGPAVGQWAQAPLGFVHCEPASQAPLDWPPGAAQPTPMSGAGDQTWIYVYNPSVGAPIAPGESVHRSGLASVPGFLAATTEISAADANAATIMGVAQYAIPAGFFAFILVSGPGVANLPAGATTGGLPLIPGAAGELAEGAVGAPPANNAYNACGVSGQAADGALCPVILDCNG